MSSNKRRAKRLRHRQNKRFRQEKKERHTFYTSREWFEARYRALKASGGCCALCGERPTSGNPLHVDHIKPRSKRPELQLTLSNLQVLCRACNMGKGAKDDTDWREDATASELLVEQLTHLRSILKET